MHLSHLCNSFMQLEKYRSIDRSVSAWNVSQNVVIIVKLDNIYKKYLKMQLSLTIISFVFLSISYCQFLNVSRRIDRRRRWLDYVTLILENLTGASRLASGCTIDPRECMSFIGNEFTLWLACLSETHPRNCNRIKSVTNTTIIGIKSRVIRHWHKFR